ncbi:Major facilitator superfamily [Cryptosporidium tyzzeri]|nr:Major facilitator superfamily [Cryptosporidium tyzzeri]
MDNTSLLRAEGGFVPPERNSKLYMMLLILISSWANSCITMIWPLLVVGDYLRLPFQTIMFLIEGLLCFFLGMTSDLKSRKTSLKYSLKIMLGSVLAVLLIVLTNLFIETKFLKLDILRYSGRSGGLYVFNSETLNDNILIFDETTNIMNNIHREEADLAPRSSEMNFGNKVELDENNSNLQLKLNNVSMLVFTLILFAICCILQSSSNSMYYNLNILIVDSSIDDYNTRYSNSYIDFAGWSEICFYNIGSYLSLLISRLTFISILELLTQKNLKFSNKTIEIDYIHIYCLNLLVLLIMIPFGYYLVEHKLKLNFTNNSIYQINHQNIKRYSTNIQEFMRNKSNLFWFLVIPYWIIYFIQSGNNFHKWIVIDQTAFNIEWWELYSFIYEAIISLILSIFLAYMSNKFSPVILQVYCFAILSMVSFGLTLCTYMLHEIPVKTFTDFISAFTLCHGIFHISCVVPSINALYFSIKFTPSEIKSMVLAIIHTILLSAPILDQIINNYSFKLINISEKFLLITAINLIGIIYTGLFMAKQSIEESSFRTSLELLPVYNYHENKTIK